MDLLGLAHLKGEVIARKPSLDQLALAASDVQTRLRIGAGHLLARRIEIHGGAETGQRTVIVVEAAPGAQVFLVDFSPRVVGDGVAREVVEQSSFDSAARADHARETTLLIRRHQALDVLVAVHGQQCADINDKATEVLESILKLGQLLFGPDVGTSEGRELCDVLRIVKGSVEQRVVVVGAL